MATIGWPVRLQFLVVTICAVIGWNYWLPTFLQTWCPSTATYYGYASADFNIFYTAGLNWLSHQNPYLSTYPGLFVYPPTLVPFYGMFALFSSDTAALLWMAAYFLVFAVASLLLAFALDGEMRSLYVSIVPLLFFTSFPLLIMMELGQSDLLVASLSMLSLVALRMDRKHLSSLILSIAVLMKGPPVLLLIYFVLYRRDMRYFVSFLGSTLVLVALSLLVVPASWYWYYLVNVAPTLSIVTAAPMNQSIVRYVSLVGLGAISPLVSISGICLFAIFSFAAGSKKYSRFRSVQLRSDALFLMNVLVMLLLGPRSWPATYVWVILPMGLFLSSLLVENIRAVYLVFVGLAVILLSSTLVQYFLVQSVIQVNHLQLFELPLLIIGNLIMISSLALLCVRPNTVIRRN